MIIPDINLLLYAHDSSSPSHAKAAGWWRSRLSGTEPVGLLDVVTFGLLHTAATDFVRFSGLRWFNPITATGSASLRRSNAS